MDKQLKEEVVQELKNKLILEVQALLSSENIQEVIDNKIAEKLHSKNNNNGDIPEVW